MFVIPYNDWFLLPISFQNCVRSNIFTLIKMLCVKIFTQKYIFDKIVNFEKFKSIWKLGNFRFLRYTDPGEWPIGFKFSVNLFYAQFNLLCMFGVERIPRTPPKNRLHSLVKISLEYFFEIFSFQIFVVNTVGL